MNRNTRQILYALCQAGILAVATISPPVGAQTQGQRATLDREQIRRAVDAVFERNIAQGTRTLGPGVYSYTRVPLSDADIGEIAVFGNRAIPVLSEYLSDPRPRFEELAVRCVGYIGGPDAVNSLRTAAISSKFHGARLQAVLWLGSLPDKEADLALKEIADTSDDNAIRANARKLLLEKSTGR